MTDPEIPSNQATHTCSYPPVTCWSWALAFLLDPSAPLWFPCRFALQCLAASKFSSGSSSKARGTSLLNHGVSWTLPWPLSQCSEPARTAAPRQDMRRAFRTPILAFVDKLCIAQHETLENRETPGPQWNKGEMWSHWCHPCSTVHRCGATVTCRIGDAFGMSRGLVWM